MTHLRSKLATALSDELLRDERTVNSQIEVLDNNGVITLTGRATTNEARQAAAEIAEHFPGVLSVTNDLEVAGLPDETPAPSAVWPLPGNSSFTA